ncbi:type I toxin-antitoxin system Fst family toxin [Lacticaseibacillus manihotivorans]|uniref:Type I toxin-antitoxin system Fst family toxin n=1 Tax=Lacticaseibacillus manihotivorans TaxID=88233 RepID=A0A5P8JUY7_9LACO|nr:type I toxin-antitoxin system Fst family toxin [Lacticaseibacillus manihotivorans]QFQ93095.1 type I toxin-antitoxin system Fst family toxin [Lacticaseibacillus manihotivorans]
MHELLTLIVAPCVVGIVTALFADWLDRRHR